MASYVRVMTAPFSLLMAKSQSAQSSGRVFDAIAQAAEGAVQVPWGQISSAITRAHADQSPAVGGGIAAPYAEVEGMEQSVCVFMSLPQGIELDSPDGEPVDLFFAFLWSPATSTHTRLRMRAEVSRHFKERKLGDVVRGAPDHDTRQAIFKEVWPTAGWLG